MTSRRYTFIANNSQWTIPDSTLIRLCIYSPPRGYIELHYPIREAHLVNLLRCTSAAGTRIHRDTIGLSLIPLSLSAGDWKAGGQGSRTDLQSDTKSCHEVDASAGEPALTA